MADRAFQHLRPELGSTPADCIWSRRAMRLLRYQPSAEAARAEGRTPLVLVPSMINRHYVMDLMRGHSLVQHLVEQGLPVYLVDWGEAADEDRFLTFDACITELLGGAVDRVRRDASVERVSLLGYCMGGTMAVIYAALHPHAVANLVNLAGPVDFSQGDALFLWTDERWFDPDLVVEALGNVPAALMQSSFSWLSPTGSASKLWTLLERGRDPEFLRQFMAIETWVNDNVPFPGEAYRKYIRHLFQKNLLVAGEYRVNGRAVDLRAITCPVLVVTASHDVIVPGPCAVPLAALCGSGDASVVELPGGHVGIVVGSGARKHLWPALDAWLLPRSGADRREQSS